jgi:hypothetical protein
MTHTNKRKWLFGLVMFLGMSFLTCPAFAGGDGGRDSPSADPRVVESR